MAHMLAMECRVVAHRVISRARNNQVAFGEKRTSTGRRGRLAKSRMTQSGDYPAWIRLPVLPVADIRLHRSGFDDLAKSLALW
jgi:hypothetical protein